MLVAIIGENCVGKSTLAKKINERLNAKIYSGKDYLRLQKSPSAATECFKDILKGSLTGENIIYIITEREHLSLLPSGAFKIVFTADLQTIKQRFKQRMGGVLPAPVEKMLEAKHGIYNDFPCDIKLNGDYNLEEVFKKMGL